MNVNGCVRSFNRIRSNIILRIRLWRELALPHTPTPAYKVFTRIRASAKYSYFLICYNVSGENIIFNWLICCGWLVCLAPFNLSWHRNAFANL